MMYRLHDLSAHVPELIERRVHQLEHGVASVEGWFGRYGALALASLTILLGVGAFLGWAVVNHLGPWARVSLGALGAGSLAVIGWRVRTRRSLFFGNVLLALALAVFQVDMWGAGPRLDLLPDRVSLMLAAVASTVLAWLAFRERDSALFDVGFGSALLAPFVTADVLDADASRLLLAYGLIILTAGLAGTRARVRNEPPWLFVMGTWVYMGWTTVTTHEADLRFALVPGIFSLVCSWVARALLAGRVSARTALAVLLMTTVFVAGRVFDGGSQPHYSALAAVIAFSALGAVRRDTEVRRTLFAGVTLLPACTLWLALVALDGESTAIRASVALAWAVMSVAFTWRLSARARDAGLATAFLCAGVVCPVVFSERTVGLTLALSAYSACAAFTMSRMRQPGAAPGIVVWLVVATAIGHGELSDRPAYAYTPFITLPSLGALAYSVAWFLTFHLLRRLPGDRVDRAVSADDFVGIGAAIAAFLWGRQELSAAFSINAAILALIAYYALTGVALIYVGQLRESLHLRPVGLTLSIYASIKAILEATQLDVGFRIAGFLLSGIFLLTVAYWYQKSTTTAAEPRGHLSHTRHPQTPP